MPPQQTMLQVARMPRLIQQDFSEERRGEERRGVGGGREGCDGGGARGEGRDVGCGGEEGEGRVGGVRVRERRIRRRIRKWEG